MSTLKSYDRMQDYIESVFNVFKMIGEKASEKKDRRFQIITLIIFNYVKKLAKDYNISLKEVKKQEPIDLIPIFEYITYNNIELYDFSNIDIDDVDVSNTNDLERYVLTHIYYITQKK
jgi:UV DNA damage repair endonuclease